MADKWGDIDLEEDFDEDFLLKPEEKSLPYLDEVPADAVQPRYYTVQQSYQDEDNVVLAGTDIEIKCSNCAMWDQVVNTHIKTKQPMCRYGRKIAVTVDGKRIVWGMHPDRHSCQIWFLPKDLGLAISEIPQDRSEAFAARNVLYVVKHLIQNRQKVQKWYQQYDPKSNSDEAFDKFLPYLGAFETKEQYRWFRPLLRQLIYLYKEKRRRHRMRQNAFFKGDVVSWRDPDSGQRLRGKILTVGGRLGEVTLAVDRDYAQRLDRGPKLSAVVAYNYSKWKVDMETRLIKRVVKRH